MRLRNALMTGMAGLMLSLGLGSDAFAQRDYYPYRDDPYRDGVYERSYYSRSHWRVTWRSISASASRRGIFFGHT